MAEATLGRLNVIIGADDSELRTAVKDAEGRLRVIDGKKVEIPLKADDEQLKRATQEAQAALDRLSNTTAEPKINGDDRGLKDKEKDADSTIRRIDRQKAQPKIHPDTSQLPLVERDVRALFSRIEARAKQAQLTISQSLRGAFVGAFAGITVANIGAMFAGMVTAAIPATAALRQLADQAGLTVEQFQELEFAMRDAGVGSQAFASASASLSRNMAELHAGTGQFLSFLRQAAPQLEQNFRAAQTTEQAWRVLADTIQNLSSRSDRLLLAQKLLGDQGTRMVGILARGSAELSEQADRARELGVVMSESAVKAAEEANRKFDELARTLTTKLKSAVVSVVEAFRQWNSLPPTDVRLQNVQKAIDDVTQSIEKNKAAGRGTIALEQYRNQLLESRNQLLRELFQLTTQVTAAESSNMQFQFDPEAANREAELRQRLNDMVAHHNALLAEGRSIIESLQSPNERLASELERLNYLHRQGAIDAKTHGQAMFVATMTAVSAYASLAAQVGNALSQIFSKNKAVAIAAAIANTAEAVTKTLAQYGGTPWGFAAAAAAAASGAAQIATIRSTSPSGGGRAPTVGSAPSIPSSGGSQSSTPGAVLVVRGMSPNEWFSGEAFRDIMERIVQWQRDGGTLALEVK